MDEITITLIISVLTMLSNIVLHFKLRHCEAGCFKSDCYKPAGLPPSPTIDSIV